MSFLRTLLNAVLPWRRRRGGPKAARSAGVALERLDHRQLLSVNFTGNVYNDFPATNGPGAVVVTNLTLPSSHPGLTIPPDIKPFIENSGFDVDGFRLVYTPADDTLSVGIQQPINPTGPVPPGVSPAIAGNPVIAGDADDNGDAGTVNPNVLAQRPAFMEFPSLQGTDRFEVFFDLDNSGTPDVVAGIPRQIELNGQVETKLFQVAQADNIPGVMAPSFGTPLQDFTGFASLIDDPARGAFEFKITHFSTLYQLETGKPLTANTVFGVGVSGGSDNDIGIAESFFPAQPVSLGLGPITPPPPVICPPLSPPVLVNPHANFHINTAHPTLVRATVLGSSGFNVEQIVPESVRLGGAAPIDHFFRDVNRDGVLDETFVFRGSEINLPPGVTAATITGAINNGQAPLSNTFSSTVIVFNRDKTFYTPAQIAAQQARSAEAAVRAEHLLAREVARVPLADRNASAPPITEPVGVRGRRGPRQVNPGADNALDQALAELGGAPLAPTRAAAEHAFAPTGPVVSIPLRNRRGPAVAAPAHLRGPKVAAGRPTPSPGLSLAS
jgi:hypothetical protein